MYEISYRFTATYLVLPYQDHSVALKKKLAGFVSLWHCASLQALNMSPEFAFMFLMIYCYNLHITAVELSP